MLLPTTYAKSPILNPSTRSQTATFGEQTSLLVLLPLLASTKVALVI